MKNTKLRNLLFETIWEQKTWYGIVLRYYYNDSNIKLPNELIIKAYQQLLSDVIDNEGIKRNDVIHNACD